MLRRREGHRRTSVSSLVFSLPVEVHWGWITRYDKPQPQYRRENGRDLSTLFFFKLIKLFFLFCFVLSGWWTFKNVRNVTDFIFSVYCVLLLTKSVPMQTDFGRTAEGRGLRGCTSTWHAIKQESRPERKQIALQVWRGNRLLWPGGNATCQGAGDQIVLPYLGYGPFVLWSCAVGRPVVMARQF